MSKARNRPGPSVVVEEEARADGPYVLSWPERLRIPGGSLIRNVRGPWLRNSGTTDCYYIPVVAIFASGHRDRYVIRKGRTGRASVWLRVAALAMSR